MQFLTLKTQTPNQTPRITDLPQYMQDACRKFAVVYKSGETVLCIQLKHSVEIDRPVTLQGTQYDVEITTNYREFKALYDERAKSCVICLNDINFRQQYQKLPCTCNSLVLHPDCCNRLTRCPQCRAPLNTQPAPHPRIRVSAPAPPHNIIIIDDDDDNMEEAEQEEEEEEHDDRALYCCPDPACGNNFDALKDLLLHVRETTHENQSALNAFIADMCGDCGFHCPHCDKVYCMMGKYRHLSRCQGR
jgi:hypothetical protein